MITRKRNAPGWVDLSPGTCFVKKDLPYPDGTTPVNGINNHPFIVISEGPDSVECLMARTLVCKEEGKDRSWRCGLNGSESAIELLDTHPPLQDPRTRSGYTDASQVICIPKEKLWDDPDLRICCDGGDKMPKPQVDRLRRFAGKLVEDYYDPWQCEENTFMTDAEYKAKIANPDVGKSTEDPDATRGRRRAIPGRYEAIANAYESATAKDDVLEY